MLNADSSKRRVCRKQYGTYLTVQYIPVHNGKVKYQVRVLLNSPVGGGRSIEQFHFYLGIGKESTVRGKFA
jgi:hypothetical protein